MTTITPINADEILKITNPEMMALYLFITILFSESPENFKISIIRDKVTKHFEFTEKQTKNKLVKLFSMGLTFFSYTGRIIEIPSDYATGESTTALII